MNLAQVAREFEVQLLSISIFGNDGRPIHQDDSQYKTAPHWQELVLFYEYFRGDTGADLGAYHPTGWTAPVS